MPTIAVTGATGFIGRRLLDRLLAREDVRVVAVARRATPIGSNRMGRGAVVIAPLERGALAGAFRGADVVVHLAGLVAATRDRDFTRVNVDGARAAALAARDAGAQLIHVSSLAAAGPSQPGEPRREDDPPRPLTPYGRSKLEGERAVRRVDGLQATILRPAAVYGPGDRAMLPLFRFTARGVMPLVGNTAAEYTFVYVEDVVRAIEAALERPPSGEPIFVGHADRVTPPRLLDAIAAAVGRRPVAIPVPSAIGAVAAHAGEWAGRVRGRPLPLNRARWLEITSAGFACRVDRMRERLGIVAETTLHEGLRATADWYRDAGWL